MITISCTYSRNTSDETADIDDTIVEFLDETEYESESDTLTSIQNDSCIEITGDNPDDLLQAMRNSDNWDNYKDGILPLIAETCPDYAKKLLSNTSSGFIAVDKSRMKVILFDRYGIEKKTYGMACAKNYGTKREKGGSRTPEGFFSVEGIYDSTDWLFTDDDGVTSPKKGQFGPRFIRLRIPGTSQIGIHGTCAPWSIGARTSHGCIRIKNENILELVELVETGMPVIVIPGRKDMMQNKSEDIDIPWIPTCKSAKEPKIKNDDAQNQKKDTVPSCPIDSIGTPSISNDSASLSKERADTVIVDRIHIE